MESPTSQPIEHDGSEGLSQLVSTEVTNGFDYSTMPEAVATKAREAIDAFHRTQSDFMQTVVLVGLALLDVREALDHGLFGQWLKAEFGPGERTAQNYMNVARRFGDKTEIVSDLPLAIAYQLAAPAVPDEARDEIVGRIEKDRIPASEVMGLIVQAKDDEKQRKAAEREMARKAKLTPEQIKTEAVQEKNRRRLRVQREAEAAEMQEKNDRERKDKVAAEVRAAALIARAIGDDREKLLDAINASSDGWYQYKALRRALGQAVHANDFNTTEYDAAFAYEVRENGTIPFLTPGREPHPMLKRFVK